MDSILTFIVQHWKGNFTGVSALQISDAFQISHEDALAHLRNLETEAALSLRATQLGVGDTYIDTPLADDDVFRLPLTYKMVGTVIAFPSRSILQAVFKKEGKDFGVFTNRLHQGDSQMTYYYFKSEVLDRYFRERHKYNIEDDDIGGSVGTKDAYYFSLAEDTRDEETFGDVRYGRVKLRSGEDAIAVIVKDLDQLPKREQHYWAAFEIPADQIQDSTGSFEKHLRESFEGDWDVEHIDVIADLKALLTALNQLVNDTLFSHTENPNLALLTTNTENAYIAGHKELYKLIGADNLNRDALKKLLVLSGLQDIEFVHKESGRPRGKWDLFKTLFNLLSLAFESLQHVANMRQKDSHKITAQSIPEAYYPDLFKSDIQAAVTALKELLKKIEQLEPDKKLS
jgi:hypothetical protein